MFIIIGEVVQQCQLVSIGTVPAICQSICSMIRLKAFDKRAMGDVELSPSPPLSAPFELSVSNGKLDTPRLCRMAVCDTASSSPGKLVQRSAEGACNIKDSVAEIFREGFEIGDALDAKSMVASICIQIGSNYRLFSWKSESLFNLMCQISKMALTVDQKADSIVAPANYRMSL